MAHSRPETAATDEQLALLEELSKSKAEKCKEKQESKLKEWHRELQLALRADPIDWDRVREYHELSETATSNNINPNFVNPSSLMGTIHEAAFAGHTDIMEWCLEQKADLNSRTSLGRSPLHYACDSGKSAAVRWLLAETADPNLGTLSQMTPLHVCCQSSSYDAILVLLFEAKQVIDVDAEDTRRRIPEALTTEKNILRAIRKYRTNLDDKRKGLLQEQALKRVFDLFDVSRDGFLWREEVAETRFLLTQHSANSTDESVDDIFERCDTNADGKIDWEEFKTGYEDLLFGTGLSFREVMQSLNEIECRIFQERVKLLQSAKSLDEAQGQSPVVSERSKGLVADRPRRSSMHTLRSLHEDVEN